MSIRNVTVTWTPPTTPDPNTAYYAFAIVETGQVTGHILPPSPGVPFTSPPLPVPNNGTVETPGTYTAQLSSFNSAGQACAVSAFAKFTISPPPPPPPPANPPPITVTVS